MPHEQLYETSIKIEGKISPELRSQLKALGGNIRTIALDSKKVGEEGKKGFELFERSVEGAKVATESLKDVLGELLLPIAGIVAAFSTVEGVFHVLDESSEKFKDLRDSATAFKATLASTDFLRAHPEQFEKQLDFFEEQQKAAVLADRGVFGRHTMEEIQKTLVGTAGLGSLLTKPLLAKIPVVTMELAHGGLESATPEAIKETTNALALFIKTGVARGPLLRQLLGNVDVKQVRGWTREQRENLLLGATYFKGADTYLNKLQSSNPDQFKLTQLQVSNAARIAALGEKWLPIAEKVTEMALQVSSTFDDLLGNVISAIGPGLTTGFEEATKLAQELYIETAKIPKELSDAWDTFVKRDDVKSLTTSFAEIGGIITGWVLALLPVQVQINAINAQIGGSLLSALQRVGDFIKDNIVHDLENVVGMLKFVDNLFHGKPPIPLDPNAVKKDEEARTKRGFPNLIPHTTPGYAAGGIVTRQELAWVGESGPELISPLAPIQKLGDLGTSQLDKLGQLNDNGQLQLDQLTEIATMLGWMAVAGGTGAAVGGIGGGSGGSGGNVFEQYPWEGHAANFGPHGNRLGEGYGVGLGVGEQAATGAHFGDMVRINFADGTSLVRQVNETSERNMGVEFFTGKAGSYNTHGAATVTKLGAGGIVRSATLALLGEKPGQREAVIPLPRNGFGSGGHSFSPTFNLGGITINGNGGSGFADEVSNVIRGNLESLMTEAFYEYQRVHLS